MKKDFLKLKKDNPIQDEREDQLGYNETYSKSLYNILESNSENFSIGVFGDYGCGKTSILNMLEEKYIKKEEVAFVKSSIWGHEPLDALKKIFLDIGKKFEKKPIKKIESDLFEEKEELDKDKLHSSMIKVLYSLGILFGLVLFSLRFISDKLFPSYIAGVVGFGSIITMLLLAYFGVATISKRKKKLPMDLSEFEIILSKIIGTLMRINKKELILVVDDLDRCKNTEELVLILNKLSIMKKDNNQRFRIKIILPFSLSKYNKNKDFDIIYSNIEKFLDSSIWISKPTGLELYKLTQGLKR